MTYAEAIQFLYGLQMFGASFGLERTQKLADQAGNPQARLRFIHVAGTNGKGSTCAMLESIYRAAGLRVGLFTSPHLVSFRERIQINRELIPETDVARLVAGLRESLAKFPPEHHPTMFEVVTVMALKIFAEQKCDLVIWETGLGGRLDATNIVTPLASVITNIGLDHQQWLGDTSAEIAAEKAGIIKPGVPVLTATDSPEALCVIKEAAREKGAMLTVVSAPHEGALATALHGAHQRTNAALALATVEALQDQIPVSKSQVTVGLATVNWPGRLQMVERRGQRFLLDGAHNLAGAEALRAALTDEFNKATPTLVLGMMRDKDCRAICGMLAPLAVRILLVSLQSPRSADPVELAAECRKANSRAEILVLPSLAEVVGKIRPEEFVVITGSLYLIGEALALLDPQNFPARDEMALNHWQATGALKMEPAAGASQPPANQTQ